MSRGVSWQREHGLGLDPENWPEDSPLRRHLERWPVRASWLAGWMLGRPVYLASLSHAAAQSPDAIPIFTFHAVTACPIAQHELRQKG